MFSGNYGAKPYIYIANEAIDRYAIIALYAIHTAGMAGINAKQHNLMVVVVMVDARHVATRRRAGACTGPHRCDLETHLQGYTFSSTCNLPYTWTRGIAKGGAFAPPFVSPHLVSNDIWERDFCVCQDSSEFS